MSIELVSQNKMFGGMQYVYCHESVSCRCPMTFAVYVPPKIYGHLAPVLWYLSGLTCTYENAMVKAGAQRYAAQHGLILVFPDTSPRGDTIADDAEYDLGQGAGFYVDATVAPWAAHFQMYTYISEELPAVVMQNFPADEARQSITGHSMGGHGALLMALNYPQRFASVSAFAPIANPIESAWGQKQFGAYLGDASTIWRQYDATCLVQDKGWSKEVLIDQGADDNFLDLLKPNNFIDALSTANIKYRYRLQPGYDHSYFFIASFIEDHVAWHAERLKK